MLVNVSSNIRTVFKKCLIEFIANVLQANNRCCLAKCDMLGRTFGANLFVSVRQTLRVPDGQSSAEFS